MQPSPHRRLVVRACTLDGMHVGSTGEDRFGIDDLSRSAFWATVHCLGGCATGEVLGLVLAAAFGWSSLRSIALAVILAFAFGYAFSLRPIVASGVPFRRALRYALAADT